MSREKSISRQIYESESIELQNPNHKCIQQLYIFYQHKYPQVKRNRGSDIFFYCSQINLHIPQLIHYLMPTQIPPITQRGLDI